MASWRFYRYKVSNTEFTFHECELTIWMTFFYMVTSTLTLNICCNCDFLTCDRQQRLKFYISLKNTLYMIACIQARKNNMCVSGHSTYLKKNGRPEKFFCEKKLAKLILVHFALLRYGC